jgi:hypothetical protein
VVDADVWIRQASGYDCGEVYSYCLPWSTAAPVFGHLNGAIHRT